MSEYLCRHTPHRRAFPGPADRILATWDPHGILDEFYTALKMTLPNEDDAYYTAQAQFEYFKSTWNTPQLEYIDLLRLAELWYMDTPTPEV